MSAIGEPIIPVQFKPNYLNNDHSVRSWLFTTDHKRVAILYLFTITIMFAIGAVAAGIIRLELITPQGDLVSPDTYNKMFSVHGIVMIFFFLVPSIPATLGNFLIPMMIGARDLAFPRVNLLSWYLFVSACFLMLLTILNGGIDSGWTFYPPYTSNYSNTNVILGTTAVFVGGFSTILTGLNFIITLHTMRAPGMTWMRLPLFCWSHYATAVIMVLATPVLAIGLVMLALERLFGIGIFNPALGGDPILFQHMFWFYSHPAVYIMVLPGMAVVSELIACFSRKRPFGYGFIAFASVAIAILGFLVWGHHMFVAGQSVYAGFVFSMLSFLVAVPSAIKVFNWTATMYRGSLSFETPMLYAIGFIGLFTIGGLTGLMVASLGIDVHVHDTYFVVAHFHYIMVGGTVLAYFGGLHFWWPKITGRMYPEGWGIFAALVLFFGFNLTFFPQFIVGYSGMVRRLAEYQPEWQVLNVLSSAGASILAIGYILPLIYLGLSLRKPAYAGANPWDATGLEWQTSSPPPTDNFETTPTVVVGPYNYHSPLPPAPKEPARG